MPWTDSYKWNHLNFLSWVIEFKAHRWLEVRCGPIPLRNRGDIPRTPASSPANKRSRVAGHVTMGGACTSAALAWREERDDVVLVAMSHRIGIAIRSLRVYMIGHFYYDRKISGSIASVLLSCDKSSPASRDAMRADR